MSAVEGHPDGDQGQAGEARPGCLDDPSSACHYDLGSHGPREVHDHPVSAPQPLAGDELAAIRDKWLAVEHARYTEERADVLRLVAEVERLRAQVERVERLPRRTAWYEGANALPFGNPRAVVSYERLRAALDRA